MTTTAPPRADSVTVLTPAGMLGAGFPPESLARGMTMSPDVIALDGGSTDSGPYYLGAATPKTTAAAVRRDLHLLVTAAAGADIPLIIGSCGTGGTDAGVDWVAALVAEILAAEGLNRRVARIYSEQRADDVVAHLDAGRVHPLPPHGALRVETVRECTHIVAMMGHEPIVAALTKGADIVLAGRATDTAVAAAVPLMRGMPAGPTWHAAKIVECGGKPLPAPALVVSSRRLTAKDSVSSHLHLTPRVRRPRWPRTCSTRQLTLFKCASPTALWTSVTRCTPRLIRE